MFRKFFIVMGAVLMGGAAIAGDTEIEATLKVDLDQVVDSGTVQPVDGITAAGQPDKAAFEVFARSGYTTVIDLRGENENRGLDEVAVVEELGMDYVLFPITSPDAISYDNARKLDKLIEDAAGPVLVHCGSSNRVGALLALSRKLDGADAESAFAYGLEGGMTGLAGQVRAILDSE